MIRRATLEILQDGETIFGSQTGGKYFVQEFENAMEYVGKTPPEAIWTTPEDDWQDIVAPQLGTGPGRD